MSSCIIIIILSVSGETNEMGKLDAMRATLEDSVASRFTTAPSTFLEFLDDRVWRKVGNFLKLLK